MGIPEVFCVRDLERFATSYLDQNAIGYYNSGADDEETLRDNVNSFKKLVSKH